MSIVQQSGPSEFAELDFECVEIHYTVVAWRRLPHMRS